MHKMIRHALIGARTTLNEHETVFIGIYFLLPGPGKNDPPNLSNFGCSDGGSDATRLLTVLLSDAIFFTPPIFRGC